MARTFRLSGTHSRILAAAITAALLAGCGSDDDPADNTPTPPPQPVACADLANSALDLTTISEATEVPASAENATPYCRIVGVINAEEGSVINVEYRLPEDWNGKFLVQGMGGFAGSISDAQLMRGVSRGYATAMTDTGHQGPGSDASWAMTADGKHDMPKIDDYADRSTHLLTTVGKKLVELHYGDTARYSYFEGCSGAGRQGMAAMQRFPEDFDGIIAGAPAMELSKIATSWIWQTHALHSGNFPTITAAQLTNLQTTYVQACDASDGVVDGLVTDPRACNWDPVAAQCPAGGEECLSPEQVEAVKLVYQGPRDSWGNQLYPQHHAGGESGWIRWMGVGDAPRTTGDGGNYGAQFMRYWVNLDSSYDTMTFDFDTDPQKLNNSLVATRLDTTTPDMSGFIERGGKMIMYHGWVDSAFTPQRSINWYESVLQHHGKAAQENARLFLVPGMDHCRGGPGLDNFDALEALENWVEKDEAPESINGTQTSTGLVRPVCAYPTSAKFTGEGDATDPANFECS